MPLYKPSLLLQPPIKSGVYPTFSGSLSSSVAVPAADILYLYPFVLIQSITFTAGHMRVQTGGAGSAVKTGIWGNGTGATNKPVGAPLFADNTGVVTTSSGVNIVIPMAGTLVPGFYWVGAKFTGTLPVMVSVQANQSNVAALVGAAISTIVTQVVGFSIADTYASALPTLAEGAAFTAVFAAGTPVLSLTV